MTPRSFGHLTPTVAFSLGFMAVAAQRQQATLFLYCLKNSTSIEINFLYVFFLVGKMCPLWPFHLFLIYLLMLGPLWIVSCGIAVHAAELLPFKFNPENITLTMDETKQITVYSPNSANVSNKDWTVISDTDQDLLFFDDKSYLINLGNDWNWTSVFNLTGNFLGKTTVKLRGTDKNGKVYESNSSLPVTVIRQKRAIDTAFTSSVATLVAIIYINFGCALDWKFLRDTLKKPIGPAIGFGCQFVFMPLVSIMR